MGSHWRAYGVQNKVLYIINIKMGSHWRAYSVQNKVLYIINIKMGSHWRAYGVQNKALTHNIKIIQLDPDNSNSDNSKSPLIRSNIHFPWSALLVIFTSLIRIPIILNHFSFPLVLQITCNRVQL